MSELEAGQVLKSRAVRSPRFTALLHAGWLHRLEKTVVASAAFFFIIFSSNVYVVNSFSAKQKAALKYVLVGYSTFVRFNFLTFCVW